MSWIDLSDLDKAVYMRIAARAVDGYLPGNCDHDWPACKYCGHSVVVDDGSTIDGAAYAYLEPLFAVLLMAVECWCSIV